MEAIACVLLEDLSILGRLALLEAVVDVLFDTVVVVVDIYCVGPCVLGKLTLGGVVVVGSWVNPSVLAGCIQLSMFLKSSL